jgi:hypothetical protein
MTDRQPHTPQVAVAMRACSRPRRRHAAHPHVARAVLLACLFAASNAGCFQDGAPGPTGPVGPAGDGPAPSVTWLGSPLAMRADGAMQQTLRVRVVDASSNRIVGLPLRFKVVSGPGALDPAEGVTDDRGEATVRMTAGNASGLTYVAAQANWGGYVVAGVESLYTDPLSVSPALLAAASAGVVVPHWSPDGQSILVEDPNGPRLDRVPLAGGARQFVGSYRGGVACPDGSNRLAVSTASDSVLVIDMAGNVLVPAFYPRPAAGYFFGNVRAVAWAAGGASLAVASNTNALIAVTPASGVGGEAWEMPVWANSLSPAGNGAVVVDGSGEYRGGIYRIDIATHAATQLVSTNSLYTYGPSVNGVSVTRDGQTLVYGKQPDGPNASYDDYDLFAMPATGGEPVPFLSSPYDEVRPEWSPDGSRVAFCSNRPGSGYNLYIYTPPARMAAWPRTAAWSRPSPPRTRAVLARSGATARAGELVRTPQAVARR